MKRELVDNLKFGQKLIVQRTRNFAGVELGKIVYFRNVIIFSNLMLQCLVSYVATMKMKNMKINFYTDELDIVYDLF